MLNLKMPDINNIMIAGNLTSDPTLRRTNNGTSVANFYIASNRKFKDNTGQWRENVCFVGVVAWYKLAESCSEFLTKGSAILVEGELQSRTWKTDDGNNNNVVEIKARRIQFLNRQARKDSPAILEDSQVAEGMNAQIVEESVVNEAEPDVAIVEHQESSPELSDDSEFKFGYKDLNYEE